MLFVPATRKNMFSELHFKITLYCECLLEHNSELLQNSATTFWLTEILITYLTSTHSVHNVFTVSSVCILHNSALFSLTLK